MLNVEDIPSDFIQQVSSLMSDFFREVADGNRTITDVGFPDVYTNCRQYVADRVDSNADDGPVSEQLYDFPDQPNLAAETRKVYPRGPLDEWQFEATALMLTFDAIAVSMKP